MADLHDLVAEDARCRCDEPVDKGCPPEYRGEGGFREVEVLRRRNHPGLEGGVEDRSGDPTKKTAEEKHGKEGDQDAGAREGVCDAEDLAQPLPATVGM